MTIYKDNCLKYLKAGYSVIPDRGKKPMIKGWQEFSKRLPTQIEVNTWCGIKDAGIAIMLGGVSGIIALDFDEIDPEIIKIIKPILPDSPVERFGSKGFVRFFQYSGENNQNVFITDPTTNKKRIVLEVLSNGKKVTVAPSIHATTNKPYTWTKTPLLEVNKNELPKFPPMLISHLQSKLQILSTTSYETTKVSEGRNLSLSTHLGNLIKKTHTILGITQDLIDFDKTSHEKPLFSDTNENEFNNPQLNALFFYMSHLRTINTRRVRENKQLELPILSSEIAVIDRLIKNESKPVKTTLPVPTGLLKDVYDHILQGSYIEQPVFALSASLSLLGTLTSRKLIFQNATPNLYNLIIGDSGTGKDSCMQIIKNLLYNINAGAKLLGATSYPSEASIIQNIDVNPVRLDIIDECSTFLAAASKGSGGTYASGIGDTLCELYSCSNSYYLGKSLASSALNVGAVHRPHINLLCATTYRGLHESISINSLEKGLFARFVVLFGENNKSGKRVLKTTKPSGDMLTHLKRWYRFENPNVTKKGNLLAFNTPAYRIPCTRTANDLLSQYYLEFDKKRTDSKSDSYHRPIISRLYQHMLKVVLLSAIGNTELDKLPIVKPGDVEFGYQFIKYFYDHITDFISDNLYESVRGLKVNKVLEIIRHAGNDGIDNAKLTEKCKFLSIHERMEIIKDLKESNKINITTDNNQSYIFHYL